MFFLCDALTIAVATSASFKFFLCNHVIFHSLCYNSHLKNLFLMEICILARLSNLMKCTIDWTAYHNCHPIIKVQVLKDSN